MAPSFVLKKKNYDRDTWLSIVELEKRQTAESVPTYTQELLLSAMTTRSAGPYH
jgi:hypothetical protein